MVMSVLTSSTFAAGEETNSDDDSLTMTEMILEDATLLSEEPEEIDGEKVWTYELTDGTQVQSTKAPEGYTEETSPLLRMLSVPGIPSNGFYNEGLIEKTYGGETLRDYKLYINGVSAYCLDPSLQVADAYPNVSSAVYNDPVAAAIMNYGYFGSDSTSNSNDDYLDTWVALIHRKGVIGGADDVNAKMERCYNSAEGARAREIYEKALANPLSEYEIKVYNPNTGSTLERQRIIQLTLEGKITVVKEDAVTGERLAGAVFTIDGVGDLTTGSDGTAIKSNLTPGTYTIREKTAPTGYLNNSDVKTVSTSGRVGTVTFKNDKIPYNLTLTKTDVQTDAALAGAEFRITGNGVDKNVTTGEDGTVKIEGLYAGTYTVTEVKAPDGYELNPKDYTIEITDKDVEQTITNQRQTGMIELLKTSLRYSSFIQETETEYGTLTEFVSEDAALENTEFTVYYAEDNAAAGAKMDDVAQVILTDENGHAQTDPLELGKYYIMETKVPDGVQVSMERQDVELTAQDSTVTSSGDNNETVEAFNDIQNVKIVLEKNEQKLTGFGKDENGEFTAEYEEVVNTGATFGIFTAEELEYEDEILPTGTLVSVLTVKDGTAETTEKLPFGKYYAMELKTGDDFILDTNKYYCEAVASGNDAELIVKVTENPIVNLKKSGTFELTKTDVSTGELLPNAGVKVYDSEKNEIFKGKTNENGKIVLENLPTGKYYYQEYSAPFGYQIDDSLFEFEIKDNGDIVKCEMTNKAYPTIAEVISNPKTGIMASTGLVAVLVGLIGLCGVVIGMVKKRKDADNVD